MILKKYMRNVQQFVFLGLCFSTLNSLTYGNEGMWQPHQLPQLTSKLNTLGLALDPNDLASLDSFPANAIVSLGGCSASFVSPQGLVVTNHHCVYGSVQYNSTAQNNLFDNGFLAKELSQEVPAAPGSRIYVTESVTHVTDKILSGTTEQQSGLDRFNTIEANTKALIKACESSNVHRCEVPSYHHGMEFYLIKKLEIKDVRLVYAPQASIGKYGGDIDNWMWPRHTGDFGFYRAYVGKDGQPADFHVDNIPYQSENYLKVSTKKLSENDYVMALGYPGRTNRYRTLDEITNQFTWYYPQARKIRETIIDTINSHAVPGSQAAIKYESTIAGLANYAKNFKSMEESYHKTDFLQRRTVFEKNFTQWLNNKETSSDKHIKAVDSLNALVSQTHVTQHRDLILSYTRYNALLSAATRLYRLAIEQEKPDAEREPGYQERDLERFEQYLTQISKRYDAKIDQAILAYLLSEYALLPSEQRVSSIDAFFKIKGNEDQKSISKYLNKIYKKTTLHKHDVRASWMQKTKSDFEKSKDPFIQFAVKTYHERMQLELAEKNQDGKDQEFRSAYMQALISYNTSLNKPIYADANSTLRVTFGTIKGNSPKDGLRNTPFTTLEGIIEKNTGQEPFNAPKKQLKLINDQDYGKYKDQELGTVPVNFLSTLDITGGNSGSATLNAQGELVGLLFDGVYESIIGDWDFNSEKNRAISVDSRYMLWVMDKVDGAHNLLEEMSIID